MLQGKRRNVGSAGALATCSALALFFGSSVAAQTRSQPGNGVSAQDSRSARIPGPTQKIKFASAVDCYPITHADSKNVITSVDDLVAEYNDGSLWLQLQADLEAILSTCKFA